MIYVHEARLTSSRVRRVQRVGCPSTTMESTMASTIPSTITPIDNARECPLFYRAFSLSLIH